MLTLIFISALIPSHSTTVRQLTGAGSANPTTSWGVGGTDLGTLWDSERGWIYAAYGDTVHTFNPWDKFAGNMLLWSGDTDPGNGIDFIPSVWNGSQVGEFIPYWNNIPVTGIAVNGRQYVHYQSMISSAQNPYAINWSSIAYSDEAFGHTFETSSIRWGANSFFSQGAFLKRGGYVYFLGTMAGRWSGVKLARVPETQMLTQSAWRYYAGNGTWSTSESAAVYMTRGMVGEMSAYYSSYFNRYVMLYWSAEQGSVVMRDAPDITGPWTGEQVLTRNRWDGGNHGYYAPYVHPWFDNYTDVYYQLSDWAYYNTFWMHSTLSWSSRSDNLLSDPSFEEQDGSAPYGTWQPFGSGAPNSIVRGAGAPQGTQRLRVAGGSGTRGVRQAVAVSPNNSHYIMLWVKSSSTLPAGTKIIVSDGSYRTPINSVTVPVNQNGYMYFYFNTANNSVWLEVTLGSGNSSHWLEVDDARMY